jgi:hypothetical protein
MVDGSGTTSISTALSIAIGEVPEMADHVPPLSADTRKVSYWKPFDAVGHQCPGQVANQLPVDDPHRLSPARGRCVRQRAAEVVTIIGRPQAGDKGGVFR